MATASCKQFEESPQRIYTPSSNPTLAFFFKLHLKSKRIILLLIAGFQL